MKQISLFLYQLVIWLPLFLAATILTALLTIIGCALGCEYIFSYYPGAYWSKFVCLITLSPVKIIGKEKLNRKQSYIFVANHQGAYDIFLMFGYLGQPIKWVMKQSLRKIPLVGWACEAAGFIFVDQSSPKAAARTIQEAEQRLKNGASIAIFPEGSRSKTGKMAVFKKGAFQMAMNLKLPIVPVTINGSYKIMPIHSYLIHPHRMELIIHEPIPTAALVAESPREAVSLVRQLSDESKQQIESGLWPEYQTPKPPE